MLDGPLQFFFGPAFDRQPAVLHQAPHDLDAVELRAVGRQELEPDALLLEQRERILDRMSTVDGGVVEHDHQGFADFPGQVGHEPQEEFGRAGAPVVGVLDGSAAQQCRHDVEAFATRGLDEVLLAPWRPGAAVGVDLREAGFIEVGQLDLASLRLGPQLVELLAGLGEGGRVALFFKL